MVGARLPSMQVELQMLWVHAVFAPFLHVRELDPYLSSASLLLKNVGQIDLGIGSSDALAFGLSSALHSRPPRRGSWKSSRRLLGHWLR